MKDRTDLPARRPCMTDRIEAGGIAAHATIGFDPATGEARELFLRPRSGRVGSDVDFLVDDIAVVISVALQHGVPAEALLRSVAQAPALDGSPAPSSIVGAALTLLAAAGDFGTDPKPRNTDGDATAT